MTVYTTLSGTDSIGYNSKRPTDDKADLIRIKEVFVYVHISYSSSQYNRNTYVSSETGLS